MRPRSHQCPGEAARVLHPKRSSCDDPSRNQAEFRIPPPALVAPATAVTRRARRSRTASWPAGPYPAQQVSRRAFGERRAPRRHPPPPPGTAATSARPRTPRPRTRPRRRTTRAAPLPSPARRSAAPSSVDRRQVREPQERPRGASPQPPSDPVPGLPSAAVPAPPGTAAGAFVDAGRRSPDSPCTATTTGRSTATASVHGSHPASASGGAPQYRRQRRVQDDEATAHAAPTPRATPDAPPAPPAPRPRPAARPLPGRRALRGA